MFDIPTGTNSLGRLKKRRIHHHHHHNDVMGLVDTSNGSHQGMDALRVERRKRHKRQVRGSQYILALVQLIIKISRSRVHVYRRCWLISVCACR